MKYTFVVNGREDLRSQIEPDLKRQFASLDFEPDIYFTSGPGDGIRYTRMYCDLHRDEERCFVACGGSGTLNEVASGLVGFKNKKLAFLAYGATNDFIKYYPGHDFHSLKSMLEGETISIDIIKAGNNYSINVINIGFDAAVAHEANNLIEDGCETAKAYSKAIVKSLLGNRFNNIKVIADGKPLNNKNLLLCNIGNGRWCGGQYLCSPNAINDDGLMEVILMKTCTLFSFLRMLKPFTVGKILTDSFCRKRVVYCRARHVELISDDLMYICNDGEPVADIKFDLDIIPKGINLILPSKSEL